MSEFLESMKAKFYILSLVLLCAVACKKQTQEDKVSREPVSRSTTEFQKEERDSTAAASEVHFEVFPIEHASMVLKISDLIVYVDPVGEAADYLDFPDPDVLLITDIHGDHFEPGLLEQLIKEDTKIGIPEAVFKQLPRSIRAMATVLENNEEDHFKNLKIKAIPMYNLRSEAIDFHPKGRGNGYLLSVEGKQIYISGDTEDIPEMRELTAIDVAFVCMNLPYTMTVEQAVDAVLEFKPKKVYPYHFRGAEEFSDVKLFEKKVTAANPDIEVEILNWYPKDSLP